MSLPFPFLLSNAVDSEGGQLYLRPGRSRRMLHTVLRKSSDENKTTFVTLKKSISKHLFDLNIKFHFGL